LTFGVCSSTSTSYTVTTGMPLNQFVLVTGTYDQAAGVLTLYLNGAVVSSTPAPNATPVVPLDPSALPGEGLGCNNQFPASAFNFSWNGSIDDMRVYDRALSAPEVQALFQSTISSSNPATATGSVKLSHY
jgi:hypothetical protein